MTRVIGTGLGLMAFVSWVAFMKDTQPRQPPPLCNHDAFHAELAAQSHRLDHLEQALSDTRMLAAFGGARMRGAKAIRVISCDGGAYLPDSHGAAAYRSLRETGLCDPPEPLPEPEARR